MAKKLSVSQAREKLTILDRILKPGESLEITRRSKKYARIELLGGKNRYDQVLESIEALPQPESKSKEVARHYKKLLYGTKNRV